MKKEDLHVGQSVLVWQRSGRGGAWADATVVKVGRALVTLEWMVGDWLRGGVFRIETQHLNGEWVVAERFVTAEQLEEERRRAVALDLLKAAGFEPRWGRCDLTTDQLERIVAITQEEKS